MPLESKKVLLLSLLTFTAILITRSRSERMIHHLLGFIHDRAQVALAREAFGVDLIDVLRARGPSGKPAIAGYNFQPSNGSMIAGSAGQFGNDGLALPGGGFTCKR